MIKDTAKKIVGAIRCVLKGVENRGGVYIGKNVHVINAKNLVLGQNVQIRSYVDLFPLDRLEIGDHSDIGTRNRISGDVIIEADVLIGPDNYICSTDHVFENIAVPVMQQGAQRIHKNGHDELRIGAGSWIGTHCAIIGDVHVGKHCVVGANSVVTKDVPDYCVVAGAPAKILKRYNLSTGKWERT